MNMKKWISVWLSIALMLSVFAFPAAAETNTPQQSSDDAQIIDIFGRTLNDYGVELVDWQGYIANPYVKLKVVPPQNASYPLTITIKAKGTSRLMMDRPSTLSATGAQKTLSFQNASQSRDFLLEIHPDRIGGNGEIEHYTLELTTTGANGTVRTQTTPIRVLDQDDNGEPDLPLKFDYRYDNIQPYFSDPDIREVSEQAIKDWFYFFDMEPFDTVPAFAETTWLPGDGFTNHIQVSNNESYNGMWIYLRGLNGPYSTGGPANNGNYHKRNGVTIPDNIHRSLLTILDFYDTATPFASLDDELWYLTEMSNTSTDVHGLIMHEFGHALAFSDSWKGMAQYKQSGGNAANIVAYQGNAVPLDNTYHIPGDSQYWDRISGQSGGRDHLFHSKRWMLTKLTLLIAEKAGWKLDRTLTPFLSPAIKSTTVPAASPGDGYLVKLQAEGGVPFYDWNITSGSLPGGLTLDRFTGEIKGTVSSSAQGSYSFTVQLRDYDEMSTPIHKQFTINVGQGGNPGNPVENVALGATASTSYVSAWESLTGLNDGYEPVNSADRGHPVYGNWDNPGTVQWVQYDFAQPVTVSSSEVYWFDDDQGIDLPASFSIQYWDGAAWRQVANPSAYGVLGNQYNVTNFDPVTTTRVRLLIQAKANLSTGIQQWKVLGTN